MKKVVVDSDAIYALYNPNDPLNRKTIEVFQKLVTQGFELVYPTSVLFEVISLFQRVLPSPLITRKLTEMIKDEQILIYIIDKETLEQTASMFNTIGSKKNTIIDCSVAVIAKKL